MLVVLFLGNDLAASTIALSRGIYSPQSHSLVNSSTMEFSRLEEDTYSGEALMAVNSSESSIKDLVVRIDALEPSAKILSSNSQTPQDPANEILNFYIQQSLVGKTHAKLSYLIRALSSEGEVSLAKSINSQTIFGVEKTYLSGEWQRIEEYLPINDLKSGLNHIRLDIASRKIGFELKEATIALFSTDNPNGLKVSPPLVARVTSSDQSYFKAIPSKGNQLAYMLRAIEMPSMPAELINITAGALGYQPSVAMAQGAKSLGLKLKIATMPSGFTLNDIGVYYFDYQHKSWLALPIDSIDHNGEIAFVPNKGSTQYFGALIKSPEMPESSAFAPTMLNDLEAANPVTGMTLINPPSISRTGEASISFPMALPSGRGGMQPGISLNYNSEGGSGIAGVGWSMPMQMIGVDTRWGVPSFDPTNQSEVYTFNGESLIEEGGHKANRDVSLRQNGPVQFFSKTRSSYQELERVNNTTDRYLWVMTDANQTKYFYGTADGTTLASDAVMQDASGNILRWYLKRVQDVWGNYVEYNYTKTGPHSSSNGFKKVEEGAYSIVLNTIVYTGHTNGASPKYRVKFNYSDKRKDAVLSLKEGVKILDHHQLDKVEVQFDDGTGFSSFKDWRLSFENGNHTLHKNRLTKIEEFRNGQFFYDHDFTYHDAVIGFGASYEDISFEDPRMAILDEMNGEMQSRRAPVRKEINGAPISSSSSEGGKFNLALGGGYDPAPIPKMDKNSTFSGNLHGSFTDTKGNTAFQDLNGDGLPDYRVRRANRDVYYPLELGNDGTYSFGAPLDFDIGVHNESYQYGLDYGLDFIASWDFAVIKFALGAGLNYNTSWSTTSRYMLDYNNDGIQDLVYEDGDQSYLKFGYYDNYRRLKFTPHSNNTLNPIVTGATPPANPSQEWPLELELVRSWVAPFTGVVDVTGTASINASVNGSMRVAVQLNDAFVDPVNKFLDVTPTASVNVAHTIPLQAGDTLFFRTRAGDNGFEDMMEWNPQVSYTSLPARIDPNGVNYTSSSPLSAFLLSGAQGISLSGLDEIKILGGSQNFNLSDDILVRMVALVTEPSTNTHTTYYFDKVFSAGTSSTFSSNQLIMQGGSLAATNFFNDFASFSSSITGINADDEINLFFEVFSSSNVDWQAIDWRPIVKFKMPGCDGQSNDEQDIYPTVDYKSYNRLSSYAGPQNLNFRAGDDYRPWINLAASFDVPNAFSTDEWNSSSTIEKQAYITLKANGAVLQKIMLRVDNSGNHDFHLINAKGESLQTLQFTSTSGSFDGALVGTNGVYLEVFVDDPLFADYLETQIQAYQIIDVTNGFSLFYTGTDYSFYKLEPSLLSDQIGHWGVFGYNQKDNTKALNPSHVKLPMEDIINDPGNDYTQTANQPASDQDFEALLNDMPDLDKIRYLGIFPRRGEYEGKTRSYIADAATSVRDLDAWVINSTHCGYYYGDWSVAGKYLEPNREIQAAGVPPSGTDIAYGRPNKTESKSLAGSFTLSVSAPLFNGYGPDASYAPSKMIPGSAFYNNPLSQMIDLNGDGYPDLMEADNGISVFFTNPQGGLVSNTGTNISAALAGKSVTTTPVSVQVGLGQQVNQDKRFLLSEPPALGFSKSVTSNKEYIGWQDVNGDGLQDLFESINGTDYSVRLNTGYGLEASQELASFDAPETKSKSYSLSTSLEALRFMKDKLSGSFTMGINIVSSGSVSERFYMDLTGDGLPDEIIVSPDATNSEVFDWSVNVNTGTDFQGVSTQAIEDDFAAANKSSNLGFTGNGNLSLSFKVFGNKVNTTGGGTYNFSINNVLNSFADVNGDGLVDFVQSVGNASESKIRVFFNENGRANKLIQVLNPLNGSFTISYELEGAKTGVKPAQVKIAKDPSGGKVMWDMPTAKWVMSQVVIDNLDFVHVDNGSNIDLDGVDQMTIDYVYDGGVFNRREKAFMGFTRIETRSPQTNFKLGNGDLVPRIPGHVVVPESGRAHKYYAEVQVFEPFTKRKFQNYAAHDYKKGVLRDHYFFLCYDISYDANQQSSGTPLGSFSFSERLLISHKQIEILYHFVDHSDPGAALGRIMDNGSGGFGLVDWNTVDETSVVFPAVISMETVVNQNLDSTFVFQNGTAPTSYFMQGTKYDIEYDDYFNVIRYTLGTASDVVTPAQVQVGTMDHYYLDIQKYEPLLVDFMYNQNLSGFRTTLVSGGLGDHYCYDVVPDDPSYNTQSICLADYWHAPNDCGAQLGDIYSIPVYFQKEVHDIIPIYEEQYSVAYTGVLIAEMEYFAPSAAEQKTAVLKDHKIYEGSTTNPPKRHSRVTNLKTGVAVPDKMENVLVGTGQAAATDLVYDDYGNVTRVTGPFDANGQRASMDYAYDSELHQFPITITNPFGESSCISYDYKFGNPLLIIDLNGHPMQYQYDDFGRAKYIWAPREYYRGGLPTIQYEYFTNAAVPVAVTTHNIAVDRSPIIEVPPTCGNLKTFSLSEPLSFSQSLKTATFVDGMGQVIQVKKESSGENAGLFQKKREVSGFSKVNDLGQVYETSLSQLEPISNDIKTLYTFNSYVDQSAIYDLLGRVIHTESLGEEIDTDISYYRTTGSNGEPADMLGIQTETDYIKTVQVIDERGQKKAELRFRSTGNVEKTEFVYDQLGQLQSYTSPAGVQVSYAYDAFGRVESENHPDRGITANTYDLAGNLLKSENPITGATGITYDYLKGRLLEVTYPNSDHINGLKYTYGVVGDGTNGVGRVIKIEQGDGFKQDDYKFDQMGNLIYEKKRINTPLFGDQEYLTQFEYDSWGRIYSMIYPDGEEVQYHYNDAGDLDRMTGHRSTITSYNIVSSILYNGFGQKTELVYGNGTVTNFSYDDVRTRRLEGLTLQVNTPGGGNAQLLNKSISYNNAGSISQISNTAPAVAAGIGGQLGGLYEMSSIQYDGMNQVTSLNQAFGQTNLGSDNDISMTMSYSAAGRLATKTLSDTKAPQLDYSFSYAFGSSNDNNNHITQPVTASSTNHRLEEITNTNGDLYEFNYDELGNISQQVITDVNGQNVKTDNYCWHENASLKGWSNGDQSANGMAAHYVYDHSGERILKTIALGGLATVNNRGEVIMVMESPTVYVNPYYIATPYQQTQMVSKHYYMGAQRVASAMSDLPVQTIAQPIGEGGGEEYSQPNYSSASDAVIIDFEQTMNCVFNSSATFAFNTMLQMPALDEVAFLDCVEGAITDPEVLAIEDPECACEQSTYWATYFGANCPEVNVMYWYHPDYLGSVEAVTDAKGEVYQFFHNTIWGEPLQQQKAFLYNSFSSRFRFNGKERDWETGNYYYGARYYDPKTSIWLSVDPWAAKYPHITPYNFVENNPIMLVDPTGLGAIDYYDLDGNRIGSDGNDADKRNFVVTDKKEVKAIKAAEKKGSHVSLGSLSSAKQNPTKASMRDAVETLDKTDAVGGDQEYSNTTMSDGTTLVGGYGPKIKVDYVRGTITGESTTAKLPPGTTDADVASVNHSHPTKVLTAPNGVQFMAGNALAPSPTDNAGVMNFSGFNIISGPLGTGNYNNNYQIFYPPLSGLAIYKGGLLSHTFTRSAAVNFISNARW